MATSPFIPNYSRPVSSDAGLHKVWIPVLFGLIVICIESTPMMGGKNTGRLLGEVWPRILGQVDTPFYGAVHHFLRKIGHFAGYGTLGLLLGTAWQRSIRIYMNMFGRQLMFASTLLAVAFTFFVGCMDEWHQSMMPGRSSTRTDVLIDTCGALLFNIVFWTLRARRRRLALGNQ